MDEDGWRNHRLRRTIQGSQERWLSRRDESGDALAGRRHCGRILSAKYGRNERLVTARRHPLRFEELRRFAPAIAVGLPVTQQPPRRSRRAVFPHRALREYSLPHEDSATHGHQAGFGATDDSWSGQCEVLTQSIIAVPSVTRTLTAPIQPLQMQPLQLVKELIQAGVVAVHSIIVVVTTELGIQPPELFLHPQMAILFAPFGCPLE